MTSIRGDPIVQRNDALEPGATTHPTRSTPSTRGLRRRPRPGYAWTRVPHTTDDRSGYGPRLIEMTRAARWPSRAVCTRAATGPPRGSTGRSCARATEVHQYPKRRTAGNGGMNRREGVRPHRVRRRCRPAAAKNVGGNPQDAKLRFGDDLDVARLQWPASCVRAGTGLSSTRRTRTRERLPESSTAATGDGPTIPPHTCAARDGQHEVDPLSPSGAGPRGCADR